MGETTTSPRLDRLTGLRFIAAFAVFAFHSLLFLDAGTRAVLEPLVGAGRSGVSFFFLLSGFVLAWSSRFGDRPAAFLRRRFARIYPAYLAALLFAAALWFILDPRGLENGLLTPFLLQSWVPDKDIYHAVNVPAWSLSVEAFFYLAFPLVILALQRMSAVALWVTAASMVAIPLLLALVAAQYLDPSNLDDGSFMAWAVYYFPVARLPEFVLGMVLALQMRAGRIPHIPWYPVVALAAVAYVAAGIWPSAFSVVGIVIVPFAALIVSAAQRDIRETPGWMRSRLAIRLGAGSYCFYLIHNIFIARLAQPGFRDLGIEGWGGVFLSLVLSLAAAWLLHRAVEIPLDKALSGKSVRSRVLPEPRAAARQ